MIHQSPLTSRDQFGQFLNLRGLTGKAVEVGTHRGKFAAIFLLTWEGELLTCVDHWDVPPGYEGQAECLPHKGRDRSEDMGKALRTLEPFGSRARIFHGTSAAAAWETENLTLDFVHIDGDHSYEGVRDDLALWWPKLKAGGILSCHDFVCPNEIDGGWGRFVQPALDAHARYHGVSIWAVVEQNGLPWTAYLIKPE